MKKKKKNNQHLTVEREKEKEKEKRDLKNIHINLNLNNKTYVTIIHMVKGINKDSYMINYVSFNLILQLVTELKRKRGKRNFIQEDHLVRKRIN